MSTDWTVRLQVHILLICVKLLGGIYLKDETKKDIDNVITQLKITE